MLMNRDVPVCEVEYSLDLGSIREVGSLCNPEWAPPCALAPNGTVTRSELDYWWASRFVPAARFPRVLEQRPVFRRLFEENRGLSLTDQYWMKPLGSEVSWREINFFANPFDEAVGRELLGTMERSSVAGVSSLVTPSAATNGMLRKYWRIANDGTRQLCKASTAPLHREPANEYAATKLMELLLDPGDYVSYTVERRNGEPWSVCDCFTDETHEYIPAASLFYGDPPLYGPDALEALGRSVERRNGEPWSVCDCFTDETHEYIPAASLFYGDPPLYGPDALEALGRFGVDHGIVGFNEALDKMMAIDALLDNNDRHLGNFGVIRNVETLQFERAVPLFDCGSSLWARVQDRPSFAPFAENTNRQVGLIGSLGWLDVRALDHAAAVVERALCEAGVSQDEARVSAEALAWRCDMLADAAE